METAKAPPPHRDPSGMSLPEYRPRVKDLGYTSIRVYYVPPTIEKPGDTHRVWGWCWSMGRHVAPDLYPTAIDAQWASIEGAEKLLKGALKELRPLVKKLKA